MSSLIIWASTAAALCGSAHAIPSSSDMASVLCSVMQNDGRTCSVDASGKRVNMILRDLGSDAESLLMVSLTRDVICTSVTESFRFAGFAPGWRLVLRNNANVPLISCDLSG